MSRGAAISRCPGGFTLLEVLVALIIVAFGMTAVLGALTSAANNTMALREKTLAEWIALNQIANVRLALSQPATGDSEGDLQYAGSKWHWQQTIDELQIPGIKRITVQVRHAPDSGPTPAQQTSWLGTVVGFRGDAVQNASGQLPDWTGTAFGSSGTTGGSSSSSGGGGGVRNPGQSSGSSSSSSGGS